MLTPEDFTYIDTYLIAHEAEKRGIHVKRIFPETKKSYLRFDHDGKTKVVIGQRASALTFSAHTICKNKEMARRFFQKAGIQTTKGQQFTEEEQEDSVRYANGLDYPVVAKPVDGTWGTHAFLDLCNSEEVRVAISEILTKNSQFLIEEQYPGSEYRILATRDKLLGIIHRIPANIIGDGIQSIEELVQEKNSDPRRGGNDKSLVTIKIDTEAKRVLKRSNLAPSSIPKKDEQVFLRKTSNLSTGGDSIDLTEKAHPDMRTLAPQIVRAIPGLPYGGFDLLTSDITESPHEVGYAVIEINASPMISMHHEPYIGKKRNVAKDIVDLMFCE